MNQVLVACTDPWLDGLFGASIIDLFESLSKLGYNVKIFLPSTQDKVLKRGHMTAIALPVRRRIPILTLVYLNLRFLQLTLRFGKIAALFVDIYLLPLLAVTKGLRGTKGIVLILSRPVGSSNKLYDTYFKISLMLSRHVANVITAISPLEQMEFARLGKIPTQKLILVPSPVSAMFTEYSTQTKRREILWKLGLEIPAGKKIVLYHGEIEEFREISKVAMSFTRAFGKKSDIILLVVGDGSARPHLEAGIQRGHFRNCAVVGPLPYCKIPEVIAACDLGLVLLPDKPWWRNQCPTKLIEFMSMKKKVVASDLPGIRWAAGDYPLITYTKSLGAMDLRRAIVNGLNLGQRDNRSSWEKKYVERFFSENIAKKLVTVIRS